MVGGALVGALALTTALLALLSPGPLSPDVTARLFAVERAPAGAGAFESVFETSQPLARWRSIYVHHSNTDSGDARSLAESARGFGVAGPPDHFVIGNGLGGADDGEIQITSRWDEQIPAAPPAQGVWVTSDCISICLIGDFDRRQPTPAQLASLEQLLLVLHDRLGIARDGVIHMSFRDSPAGIGVLFPDGAGRGRSPEPEASDARIR